VRACEAGVSMARATSEGYLRAILNANVYDVAVESPLDMAPNLTMRLGTRVLLKREDLQPVFSFKLRGAYNKMSRLLPREGQRGVITASAGNHAQGVALAAEQLGIGATIVMPLTTPRIKVEAVASRGAEIVLEGDSYDEAHRLAVQLGDRNRRAFVHPYDDPLVIAGQGTVGLELIRQARDLEAVFVPVGGGGLIAGIAVCVKALRPDVRIVGVEPSDANAMQRSLESGRRIVLPQIGQFADGVAVRQVGKETFKLARLYVDEVIVVDTDEVCAAIKDVFEDTRSIVEPAAALSVAGAKRYAARGRTVGPLVAILSGANMNFDRLRFVAERAELGERREAIFAATIPERPGSFQAFCKLLGRRSITEFNYRYDDPEAAHVFVGVAVRDGQETDEIIHSLMAEGIPVLDLSDNEMAKLHIRHLVGGRAGAAHEVLYRFEFPERPGALMRFLDAIGRRWNISLFHYRNHGADYGRVLAGLQVPPAEKQAFRRFLANLGYEHHEETGNAAYRLFLASS
jgi:threonine dehydratase